jgi:hypothetical protein
VSATVARLATVAKADPPTGYRIIGPSSTVARVGSVAPVVDLDSNASTRLVAEALRTGQPAYRLSAMVPAPAFDLEAYLADPAGYLVESIPARALQGAQPGPGVPMLRASGPTAFIVRSGHQAELAIQAVPGAPVSLACFDLGLFPNGLQAISLQAGPDGVARTQFLATSGSVGRVSINAASPICTGRLTLIVEIPE